MNPNCFSTVFPRVPGLCICEKCALAAPKEQKQKWFLHKPEYRKWVNTRTPNGAIASPQNSCLHSKKLAKEILTILEDGAITQALTSKDLHQILEAKGRSVTRFLVRSTLRWMLENQTIEAWEEPHAKGAFERHYFALHRQDLRQKRIAS